jgi:pyridoxamine 5'-phosphate oxidase
MRDREQLLEQYAAVIRELGLTPERLLEQGNKARIPRPGWWGGYRLFAQRVELWLGGPGRMHDRAVWERGLAREGEGYRGSEWNATRLQP